MLARACVCVCASVCVRVPLRRPPPTASLDAAKKSELEGVESFKGLVELYLDSRVTDMHVLRMSHFFHCLTILSTQMFPLGDRMGHCL